MVKISAEYKGQKNCLATHEPSQTKLNTDAPKDNQGLGESFSPTDLVATALGTCILTTIAIQLEKDGLKFENSKILTEKVMTIEGPRRIKSLHTLLELPHSIPENFRVRISEIASNCPVKKSLHPEIDTHVEIRYSL